MTHFNGMWAIALWDSRRRRLMCSRDRFGIKPFYYRWDGRRFSFASEPRAFRRDPHARLEPNPNAISDFIMQGRTDHRDETFFRGTRQLPPGHSMVLDENGIQFSRYWRLAQWSRRRDVVASVRDLFIDSVRLRLRSDVPLGTALSGGMDSSAVAGAVDYLLRTEAEDARPVGERQETFTVYFEDQGFDERVYANAVARRIVSRPHLISFDEDDLIDALPIVVESQGEPFGSTSIIAQWFVMREARAAGIKVMLDGQGGDETLAGYPTRTWAYRFADLLANARFRTFVHEARKAGLSPSGLIQAVITPVLSDRAHRSSSSSTRCTPSSAPARRTGRWTPRTSSSRRSPAANSTASARRRSTSTGSTSRRTPHLRGASSRSSSASRRSRTPSRSSAASRRSTSCTTGCGSPTRRSSPRRRSPTATSPTASCPTRRST